MCCKLNEEDIRKINKITIEELQEEITLTEITIEKLEMKIDFDSLKRIPLDKKQNQFSFTYLHNHKALLAVLKEKLQLKKEEKNIKGDLKNV